jgi:hypothetical protein
MGTQGRKQTAEAEATQPEGALSKESWEREGGMAPMPRPLSIMQEEWHVQPPFFHPEHLELMFELRSLVEDQIHRAMLISQRIDMLYDAYSNKPPGQRCPTCAHNPSCCQPGQERRKEMRGHGQCSDHRVIVTVNGYG